MYGNWIPGAILRVYSRRRRVWHYGIAAEWGPCGPMVMHASKDRGQFLLTAFDEFREGQQVEYVQVPDNQDVQRAILQRAKTLLGSSFDLLTANCEDYVNWIVTGVARSPQREAMALAVVAVVGIFALSRVLAR